MLKSFKELYQLDIKDQCEKRDGVLYLNWAKCKKLLHDNGASVVYFEPLTNENGSTLFASDYEFTDKNGVTNRCYEVRVKIVVDDLIFVQNYPVLNGNNPVKDNSMSQLRVSNAQARAFVKGVAIRTGLGFQLWCENDESTTMDKDFKAEDILAVKKLAQEEYSRLLAVKKLEQSEIVNKLGLLNFDVLKAKFAMFDECYKFIKDLESL